MEVEPPSAVFIETSHMRMSDQLEMVVKTPTMIDQRTEMLEEKLRQFQASHGKERLERE
jgi:hypothetical protein